MEEKLDIIELRFFDEDGIEKNRKEGYDAIRISAFFDFNKDNHHIQFPKNVGRIKLGNLLHELADRILNYK